MLMLCLPAKSEVPKRSRFCVLLRSGASGAAIGSLIAGSALAASADTTAVSTIGPDSWSSVTGTIGQQVNVVNVVAVIAASIAACITLVFMWWGVRKGVRMLMSAFKKGKLRV